MIYPYLKGQLSDKSSLLEYAECEVRGFKLVYRVSDTGEFVAGRSVAVKGPKLGSGW